MARKKNKRGSGMKGLTIRGGHKRSTESGAGYDRQAGREKYNRESCS